jgi:hypothetical protein
MHLVKEFPEGARLQVAKAYRKDGRWLYWLDFYPGPRALVLGGRAGSAQALAWADGLAPQELVAQGFENAQDPFLLYLRAHFVGAKLVAQGADEAGTLVWDFVKGPLKLRCALGSGEALLQVEGRKDYMRRLELAPLAQLGPTPAALETAAGPVTSDESPEVRAARKKREKLLGRVQGDVASAEGWLAAWSPVCELLREDPLAWGRPQAWEPALLERVRAEVAAGHCAPFVPERLGEAQDHWFRERRKWERRLLGARKRLQELEAGLGKKTKAPLPRSKVAATSQGQAQAPKKKPGVWVEVMTGLWARVGRSAQENAELFKQARDRDLWFHVRGQSGCHVWIPRGQPGLGSKAEPSEELLEWGAQLALANSRAARSGAADVDWTERRYLRTLSGEQGTLKIQRSETRHVRLDRAFEKRVFGKGGV